MRTMTVASILVCAAAPVAAQTTPQQERGAELAVQWCAECHAVGAQAQSRALTGAPSFADIALRDAASPDNLRRKLLGNHPIMPEFPISNDEINALSAYIKTLKVTETRASGPAPVPVQVAGAAEAAGAGKALVSENCSPCHALEGEGPSPVADAPVFATLSERYPVEYLAEALAEGILVGHPEVAMPEFVFSPDEVSAIIAFLNSIQAR